MGPYKPQTVSRATRLYSVLARAQLLAPSIRTQRWFTGRKSPQPSVPCAGSRAVSRASYQYLVLTHLPRTMTCTRFYFANEIESRDAAGRYHAGMWSSVGQRVAPFLKKSFNRAKQNRRARCQSHVQLERDQIQQKISNYGVERPI